MPKKILVVDDNPVLLKFVRKLMETEGHEVQTAEDGFVALNLLAAFVPDVIIVDLIMPMIGGDKLCQIVRKMQGLEHCYIIILSAAAAELDFDPSEIGADTCIAKSPFGQMGRYLLEAVNNAGIHGSGDGGKTVMGADSLYVRQMTKELLSRNRHLQTILESLSEGIVELFDGRIVYVNSAAVKLFGKVEEHLLALDPADLFLGEQKLRVQELLSAKLTGVRSIGRRLPVYLNNRLVTMKRLPVKGTDQASILLIHDVTERQNLEMQLQHVQKMETVGTIASGVAHNFRNTLAGILMNNQLIQYTYPDDANLAEITGRIATSVKRGTELVDSLMQFSRKQVHKELQRINLVQVIVEMYQLIRKSFDQRIQILVDVPESLCVMGDVSGLSLALLNLCTNARDAMPQGGKLSISARAIGNTAEVRVADTGMGMAPEVVKNCFDPFFTTKRAGQGTGLGLSTTYGIIQNHGGKISVSSSVGMGASFTVCIPLVAGTTGDETLRADDISFGSGEKVLVVDDDREFLEAFPSLLEKLGYRVSIVTTAHKALESVCDWKPDVVLLDRNLPDMDGFSCAQRIIALRPETKIAILSGYEENGPQDIDKGCGLPLHGYLTKPVGLFELSRHLKQMLETANPAFHSPGTGLT